MQVESYSYLFKRHGCLAAPGRHHLSESTFGIGKCPSCELLQGLYLGVGIIQRTTINFPTPVDESVLSAQRRKSHSSWFEV